MSTSRTIEEEAADRAHRDDDHAKRATMFRSDLLAGQSILISGGGSGIGRATAFLAARLGARVFICGRDLAKLSNTTESIASRLGVDIGWASMTIRNGEDVDALMEKVFDRFGGLDILVNNAGGQFAQDSIDFSRKGWNAVIDTNLNGTWFMMQAAAQRWRQASQSGQIVNIVSTVERGIPHQAHSCAARAGVIHVSRTVAVEWAPLNIRVNCVAPGVIATTGLNNYPGGMKTRLNASNPMRTSGDAWDIAEAILYLSGPSAKFITGEVLHVNGGSHLWGNSWALGVPDYFKDA